MNGGLLAALLVMIVLLVLTPVFKYMPQNAQGAIVISAVVSLFNYTEWWFLWKVRPFSQLPSLDYRPSSVGLLTYFAPALSLPAVLQWVWPTLVCQHGTALLQLSHAVAVWQGLLHFTLSQALMMRHSSSTPCLFDWTGTWYHEQVCMAACVWIVNAVAAIWPRLCRRELLRWYF